MHNVLRTLLFGLLAVVFGQAGAQSWSTKPVRFILSQPAGSSPDIVARLPELPDVPTISATYPGFEYVRWHALVAPAGTPREVVQRVNRDMDQVLKDPEIVKRLADLGPVTDGAARRNRAASSWLPNGRAGPSW